MQTCKGKVKGPDGSFSDCPCLRHIPRADQNPNEPHLCRDCTHIEGAHPHIPTSRTIDTVIETLKPKLAQMRASSSNAIQKRQSEGNRVTMQELCSDDNAYKEVCAGFRQAPEAEPGPSRSGRGGVTKFQVSRLPHKIMFNI